jgi:hypothetical protein
MSRVFTAPSRKAAIRRATVSLLWPPSVRKKKSSGGSEAIGL